MAADREIETLERRIEAFRAFAGFRRSLRDAEEVEQVAEAAQTFALEQLCASSVAIYSAENESADFALLASAGAPPPRELPGTIERTDPLTLLLENTLSAREGGVLEAFGPEDGAIAVALRSSPSQLVGILVLAGAALRVELLEELAFDLESALASRIVARLRAEELAMLVIQERELVGLLKEVEARDAIIQRDLEEARQFQRKMLGAAPRVAGAAVEVIYEPLGLVGGDLYAVSVDGDRVRLFVADATGHGVRASLTTMFIKSDYEAVRHAAADPARLLAALNDAIAQKYRSSEMLFSAACVDVELATGRATIASAAHPPVCIVRSGEAVLVEGTGAFLGVRAGMTFHNTELTIAPGDGVYLYTDGFVEARRQSDLFGDDRLLQTVLEAHSHERPAGAALIEAVKAFLGEVPLDDDGTFVGMRYVGVHDTSTILR